VFAAALAIDRFYVSGLTSTFMELEKERIETSNKLATAKIVHENLNHVRDLVFENMEFASRKDSVLHETHIFNFITTCVNDLKLNLLSVKPLRPRTQERVTTCSYDIELEGDFFKFGELCSKFENSRRIIAVESYEVRLVDEKQRAGGGPEHKMIRVSMRINTYRVKKS
jgi:Tfp pilus assembly protein PilO